MPIDLHTGTLILGLLAGNILVGMILWSILFPSKRLWPPRTSTTTSKVIVWLLTITVFSSAIMMGILDWNALGLNSTWRWIIGLGLILAGNVIVWAGVAKIGMEATSGGANRLITDGIYSWSRNPQYLADISILCGWAILAASLWALPVIAVGIVALLIAPLAEEPWLEGVYGENYNEYKSRVGRFL